MDNIVDNSMSSSLTFYFIFICANRNSQEFYLFKTGLNYSDLFPIPCYNGQHGHINKNI